MIVYDKDAHKLLTCCSVRLEQADEEIFGRKGNVVVFNSPDGDCIKRVCLNYVEGCEYMDELAAAADVTETLIIVDNSLAACTGK